MGKSNRYFSEDRFDRENDPIKDPNIDLKFSNENPKIKPPSELADICNICNKYTRNLYTHLKYTHPFVYQKMLE
jgi:hypothetical protein